MIGSEEIFSVRHGKYRAFFAENDLGILIVPPEIRTDCEIVKAAVHDENTGFNYREIGNTPRLFGSASLQLPARDSVWQLLAESTGLAGILLLEPEIGAKCGSLTFPAATLLPRWEFEPAVSGPHILRVHFNLVSDSAGKLFYYT